MTLATTLKKSVNPSSRLSQAKGRGKRKREPLWAGPESGNDNGGITFSMLSRWLCCRERFRIVVVEGLKVAEDFNQRLEYGNMWHTCEEALANRKPWEPALKRYAQQAAQRCPTQVSQVETWFNVCRVQFPVYVKYWKSHPDVKVRTPVFQEEVFHIPYKLPSGRVVYLRGKFDSVDLIGKGRMAGIFLQENKTKADIVWQVLQQQLLCDLQTMIYLIALREGDGLCWDLPGKIKGVRYNVVRRPISGGKYTIVQKKGRKTKKGIVGAETDAEFYKRLGKLIAGDPDHFFMRWKVEFYPGDIERFQRRVLDPMLEELCDWWNFIMLNPFNPWEIDSSINHIHFQYPHGIWNPTLEGRTSDVDEYLSSGSELGLRRVDDLFPELRTAA